MAFNGAGGGNSRRIGEKLDGILDLLVQICLRVKGDFHGEVSGEGLRPVVDGIV